MKDEEEVPLSLRERAGVRGTVETRCVQVPHGGRFSIMPRIKTTRTVTIALIVLRCYLIVMLGLILLKFVWGFR